MRRIDVGEDPSVFETQTGGSRFMIWTNLANNEPGWRWQMTKPTYGYGEAPSRAEAEAAAVAAAVRYLEAELQALREAR